MPVSAYKVYISPLFLEAVKCDCLYFALPENKAIGVMKPGHTFTIEPMINEGECRLIADSFLSLILRPPSLIPRLPSLIPRPPGLIPRPPNLNFISPSFISNLFPRILGYIPLYHILNEFFSRLPSTLNNGTSLCAVPSTVQV